MKREPSSGSQADRKAEKPPVLSVSVHPKAGFDRLGPFAGGVLKISVKAPPDRGKANEAVAALLARALGLKKSQVSVVRGFASRKKDFRLEGIAAAELGRFLETLKEKDGER